jgi:uncharacterized protein (DUF2236 family)
MSPADGEPSDRGLLGPDSVAWRVIGHPVVTVGGLGEEVRAVRDSARALAA